MLSHVLMPSSWPLYHKVLIESASGQFDSLGVHAALRAGEEVSGVSLLPLSPPFLLVSLWATAISFVLCFGARRLERWAAARRRTAWPACALWMPVRLAVFNVLALDWLLIRSLLMQCADTVTTKLLPLLPFFPVSDRVNLHDTVRR